jgi:hypothetical protein
LAARWFARIILLDLAVFVTRGSDLNRIGGHLSRRTPSQRSSQLEATGNITESVAEIGANEGKRSDGRDRDQGGGALLTARKVLQTKNHDVEMSLRGVLRGFGLKVGRTTPRTFPGRIRELVADHPTLLMVAEALLAARSTLFEQWQRLEKRL